MELLHIKELFIIEWIQHLRSPSMDLLFKFLNFFDTGGFYLLLIPILFLGVFWKWGARIVFFLLFSSMINTLIKALFATSRPFDIIDAFGVIQVKSFGFPSGAAQSAILLAGILIYTWRNPWAWAIGINYIFWISLSRLYLGVHFLSDVIGGWIVGGGLLLAYIYLLPRIEKWCKNQPLWVVGMISQLLFPLLYILYPTIDFLRINTSLMGLSMGLILASHYHLLLPASKNLKEGIVRSFFAFCGLIALYFLVSLVSFEKNSLGLFVHQALSCYLFGMWLSLGAPAFCGLIPQISGKEKKL